MLCSLVALISLFIGRYSNLFILPLNTPLHTYELFSIQDPILTAFELSWELRQLAFAEHEFKSEYLVICQYNKDNLSIGAK